MLQQQQCGRMCPQASAVVSVFQSFVPVLQDLPNIPCTCLAGAHGHEQSGLCPYSFSGNEIPFLHISIHMMLLLTL